MKKPHAFLIPAFFLPIFLISTISILSTTPPCFASLDIFYKYYNEGVRYLEQGNNTQAIEAFNKSLQTSPDPPDAAGAYVKRSIAYAELKNYTQALKDCDQAIKIYPQGPDPYYMKGLIYFTQKDYHLAKRYINKALEMDPNFLQGEPYYIKGHMSYNMQSYKNAIEHYSKYISFGNPKFLAEAYLNRGNCYYYLEQYDRAGDDYFSAFKLDFKGETGTTAAKNVDKLPRNVVNRLKKELDAWGEQMIAKQEKTPQRTVSTYTPERKTTETPQTPETSVPVALDQESREVLDEIAKEFNYLPEF